MNKHRKAEARKVKAYVRILRAVGCNTSYKKARRHIRKRERAMRDLPKNVKRAFRKGIEQCDYGVSRAFARITERAIVVGGGLRNPVGISAIAESLASYLEALTERKLSEDKPMEETPALWPKENPHIPKEDANDRNP